MKFQEKLPLPLDKIVKDLADMNVDANVIRTNVEYDTQKVGTDVILTLTIKIDDIFKDRRKTNKQRFDDAMDIL